MYGNKVGMEETQEYNYPTSIAYTEPHTDELSILSSLSFWPHKSPRTEWTTLVLVNRNAVDVG